MANKSGYFTDSEGNKLLGATLGENVFLSDGTDLETKLNNIENKTEVSSSVVLSESNPRIVYRKVGHILFVYINTQSKSYTGDVTLGTLPADCVPLMGNREYRGNGLIAIDPEDTRIWARDIEAWTAITMVLPI